MRAFSNPETRRYAVIWASHGWAVEQGGRTLQTFAVREVAIAFACRLAQSDADRGRLGLVTAGPAPEEIHCFTPGQDRPAPPRPRPRLVWSR